MPDERKAAIGAELADVLFHLVRLADRLDVDLGAAAADKLAAQRAEVSGRPRSRQRAQIRRVQGRRAQERRPLTASPATGNLPTSGLREDASVAVAQPASRSISALSRRTKPAGSRAGRPRRAAPGRTAACAQSPRRSSGSAVQPLHQRMVRIDLEDRHHRRRLLPGRSSAAARDCPTPRPRRRRGTPANRSGGCVTRTSFTRSPSAFARRSTSGFSSPASFSCSRLLLGVGERAEVERALGDRRERLAVELGQARARPTRRCGRTAAAPRCPSCGRSRGAGCSPRPRSVSAVT